jgi:hypothetical protein
MALYVEDGAILARPRCVVAGFFHSHGMTLTKTETQYLSSTLTAGCCGLPAEAEGSSVSTADPVLLYSDFGAGCSDGRGEKKECGSGCVYGMNFGPARGPSTLSVGAAPLTQYEKWSDPGAPYGPGHYAEICGKISGSLRPGSLGIQLTTRFASSNTLSISLGKESPLLVEARKCNVSER